MKQISVRVPDHLATQFKEELKKRRTTAQEVLTSLLTNWLTTDSAFVNTVNTVNNIPTKQVNTVNNMLTEAEVRKMIQEAMILHLDTEHGYGEEEEPYTPPIIERTLDIPVYNNTPIDPRELIADMPIANPKPKPKPYR